MHRKTWLPFALCLLPRLAQAQEQTGLDLTWQAPVGCPTKSEVLEQVGALVDAPDGQDAPLRAVLADGRISETDGGYQLDLVLRDGELVGRRRFAGDSCAEVTGAAAVAIALLMRPPDGGAPDAPAAGAAAASSTHTTTSSPDGNTSAREQDVSRASQTDSSERELHALVVIPSFGAGFGLLEQPSLGIGAGIGLEPGRWRFVLSGWWHPEATLDVGEVAGTSVNVSRQTVSAQGCRWLMSSRFQFAPCLTLSLQLLSAGAAGTQITTSPTSTAWLALGPAALGRLRLGQVFALTASLGLEVQTARPRLVIAGLGTVEQIGPLEMMVGMGAEWIF